MLPSPATVCFFLPGLAHQFGNLLLTIQGQVLHLDVATIERARAAVLTATNRGAASLQVLRAMSGEPVPATADAGELVALIAELARVPVRERGRRLELRGELPTPPPRVGTGSFVAAVAEALCTWVEALPAGVDGTVTLGLCGADEQAVCRLQIGFEPIDGTLPFPPAAEHVAAALASRLRSVSAVATAAGGLQLAFPAAASSALGGSLS